MLHPLIKLIASRPDLLAEHAAGYAELAAAEASEAVQAIQRQALLMTTSLVLAGVATGLTGMALLLAAALPTEAMPAPWALVAVPAVVWVAAASCAGWARGLKPQWGFAALREQWNLDARLLSEAQR